MATGSTSRPAPRTSMRGFTLLELIVVMVIVAMGLTVVAVGVNRWLLEPQQTDPVGQLQMDLIRVRNQASIDDAAVTVYVDFKLQELSAFTLTGGELLRFFLPDGYRFEPDIVQFDDQPGQTLAVSEERVIWVFQPDGKAQDSSFQVVLPEGGSRRVIIRGGSGRILVVDPETGVGQ